MLNLEAQLLALGVEQQNLEDNVDDAEQLGFHIGHRDSTVAAREKLSLYLRKRIPEATSAMLEGVFRNVPPSKLGRREASDKACTFWAMSLISYTSPESPDLSQHGAQVFTALLSAFPFGLPLTRAVEHKIRVWRTTPEGEEMISDSRSVSDDSVRLVDMRNIISGTDEEGRTLEPQDDMITTLFDIINMSEIESAQRSKETEEVSADGSDNDDNASQCSAGSRREEPHPEYRVEAKLPDSATPDEVAQAAAKTAADVREWNRQRGRVDDKTLTFPPQRWRTLEQALGSAQLATASWTLSMTPTSPRCVPRVRLQGSLRVP